MILCSNCKREFEPEPKEEIGRFAGGFDAETRFSEEKEELCPNCKFDSEVLA